MFGVLYLMGFLDIFQGVGMLFMHPFSSTVSGKGFASPLFLRVVFSEGGILRVTALSLRKLQRLLSPSSCLCVVSSQKSALTLAFVL